MGLVRETCRGLITCAAIVCGCLVPSDPRAAELPTNSRFAVQYVRVCSSQGAGFFTVSGTDTCLRIGGRVRGEFRYLEPGTRADDAIGFRARSRIDIDARTPTSYGLLRAHTQYELTRNSGNLGSDTTSLELAYIQFGGLTAGRTQSFFDFYTNDYNFGAILVSDFKTQVWAYTEKIGPVISASVALEDGIERRQFTAPNGSDFPGQEFISAGARVPDLIGQLRWEPDWGKVQLSAALRQIRSDNFVSGPSPAPLVETEYGFAVQSGLQVKLPALAEGDQLWLLGAYALGALSYLGFGNTTIKDIDLNQTDAYIDASGKASRSRGWAATVLFVHFWTPQLRQVMFGSYGLVGYRADSAVMTSTGGTLGFVDTIDWRIGSNLGWLPVSDLYLGVEALYRHVDPRGRVFPDNDPASGRLINAAKAVEARVRVQRDF